MLSAASLRSRKKVVDGRTTPGHDDGAGACLHKLYKVSLIATHWTSERQQNPSFPRRREPREVRQVALSLGPRLRGDDEGYSRSGSRCYQGLVLEPAGSRPAMTEDA